MIGQNLHKRYTITERLGKGAMGTVYRATDSQSGQDVALKVISSELTMDPEMLERFKREGEALRKLKHSNIVGFIDAFQHEENYVIVMEFVSHGNLHEMIKNGPIPIEDARRITLELCDALSRSHHVNIIHRDIKPENILMDQDGTPRLADFGVARLSEGTRMTRSGTQVGTPYYMAPEAWEGKLLTAQADIWSLGVVFFEMLAGQVPFGGDTGAAVMTKVLTTQPPDLKKLRPDVPPGLAKIIKRMLSRDNKVRYQTMREVAVDLERGQSVSVPVGSKMKMPKIKMPAFKMPSWLPVAIVVGLVMTVGGFLFADQIFKPASPQSTPTLSPAAGAKATRNALPTNEPSTIVLTPTLSPAGLAKATKNALQTKQASEAVSTEEGPSSSGIITDVILARDVEGVEMNPVDPTTVFNVNSIVHAVVRIEDSPASTTFTAEFYVVDVGDAAQPNSLITSTDLVADTVWIFWSMVSWIRVWNTQSNKIFYLRPAK
jgi:serine/threonine protein kinase